MLASSAVAEFSCWALFRARSPYHFAAVKAGTPVVLVATSLLTVQVLRRLCPRFHVLAFYFNALLYRLLFAALATSPLLRAATSAFLVRPFPNFESGTSAPCSSRRRCSRRSGAKIADEGNESASCSTQACTPAKTTERLFPCCSFLFFLFVYDRNGQ